MNDGNFQIETFSDLDDIAQRWAGLEECGLATPFQGLAWCRTMYKHIGRARGAVPCIVMVHDKMRGNDVLLLPLWLYKDRGGRRKISLFDMGVSDYSAPVVAREGAPDAAAMRLIWPRILKKLPAADYLHITKIPEKIGNLRNPLLDMAPVKMPDLKSWDVELPADWDDYRKKIISRSSRRNLGRKWRKLKTAGEPAFIHTIDTQEAEQVFKVLLRQRRARFAELGREEILERENYTAFYREMLLRADTPAIITALKMGDDIIAALYGLIYNNTYYMLLSSFEGNEWGRYSPGLLIAEAMMEWLHGRGITIYDFTIGSEPYKQKMGGIERDLHEHMHPFSLQGHYLSRASSARRTIKGLLK